MRLIFLSTAPETHLQAITTAKLKGCEQTITKLNAAVVFQHEDPEEAGPIPIPPATTRYLRSEESLAREALLR